MRYRFIDWTSKEWGQILTEIPHDFYHLPQYVALSASDERGAAKAFVAERGACRVFIPFILRELPGSQPDEYFDVTTPYGYASPIFFDPNRARENESFFQKAIQQFFTELREHNVVSAFLRLNPVLDVPLEFLRGEGNLVFHGQTVVIDLTLSEESLWQQTRSGHRSEINRAKRQGHVVAMDEDWAALEDFYRAYSENMRRVGAGNGYFFPLEYFEQLRDRLADCLHLCVVRIGGLFASAAIFSELGGIVQYHLSGTLDDFARMYPTKIMLDFVRRWAKGRGNHCFHLGGGLGAGEDSLFQFKAGFSKLRAPFHTWRVVVDEHAYSWAVKQWGVRSGRPAPRREDFFPAYRAA